MILQTKIWMFFFFFKDYHFVFQKVMIALKKEFLLSKFQPLFQEFFRNVKKLFQTLRIDAK